MNSLNRHISTLINLWRNGSLKKNKGAADSKCGASFSKQRAATNRAAASFERGAKNTPLSTRAASQLSAREIADAGKKLLELQRGLTGGRNLAGAGYMQDSGFLGAYLLYYWPVTYMQIHFAVSEFPEQLKERLNKKELRLLDLGSGPAPASASLCDEFPQIKNVTLVDSSEKSLTLGKSVLTSDFKNLSVETLRCDFERCDFEKTFPALQKNSFDIIVMSHALNELWKNQSNALEKRRTFLLKVADYLTQDGILLLNEPALLKTSRELIFVRNSLLNEGFFVLSPCLCSAECPALLQGENHTCHSEKEWVAPEPVASLAKAAGLDRESVKMSFFALSRTPLSILENDEFWRVVSDSMLNKSGRIRYLICSGKKRVAFSAKKDDSNAQKKGFFNLKRYDCFKIEKPELRGEPQNPAFGVNSQTEILPAKKLP